MSRAIKRFGSISEIRVKSPVRSPFAGRIRKKAIRAVEDWTGEVTFRYEKNGAPRVVQQQAHLADGDYVVEIELITEGGRAVTTRKIIALSGGSTTIDISSLAKQDIAKDGAP